MKRTLLVLLIIVVLGQLVPVNRANPELEGEVPAPAEVRTILRRSCYDCHSHESRWPWYGYIAPVSWLMAYDIDHAREHLNFSTWNRYDAEERSEKLEELWEEVEEGEMPLWYYLPLHPEARLDESQKELLRAWATGESGPLE